MSALYAVFKREVALAWGAGGGAAAPVGFFLGAATLLPFALGTERALLRQTGAPLLWIAAALAALMTLERLFQADLEDGGLDHQLLAPQSLTAVVAAKAAALWVAVGLPLAAVGALAAIALQTPPAQAPVVALQLAVGMGAYIAAGLVGAAVAAGVRRGGVLIALLVLPFFAPIVIFGAAASASGGFGPAFLVLCALTLGAWALGPVGAAAALRVQAD
ncbi:MAG: heme exporter protein CcmB [Alphaproteobacteria bacterium]|nr:heme exporter protein CcmB [Alphaproteobacteria bacterium]